MTLQEMAIVVLQAEAIRDERAFLVYMSMCMATGLPAEEVRNNIIRLANGETL